MYYIYKTTNLVNSKVYIGVHYSENIDNDNYLGSGKALRLAVNKYGRDNFNRQILYEFNTFQQAYAKERQIVNDNFIQQETNYNIKRGGWGGWKSKGQISVKDTDGNKFIVKRTDPRWLSGQLVGQTKGKVVVKDKDGNIFQTDVDDPRYLSGQLVGNIKGKVTVKDSNGLTFQVDRDDPRYLSGQLTGITKGCRGENWARYGQSNWIKDKIWIHNFELKQNKLISNLDCIPLGWSKGRKIFSKELSERIGGKGTIQIYNPETLQHRKISQNQKIPQGFIRGQNYQRKNTTIINLDTGQKRIIGYNEVIPQGFVKGWSKKLLKSLNKLSSLQLLRQQVILN